MFSPDTYRARRAALASSLGSGLAVVVGNDEAGMNYRANAYPFWQDTTVRWLGGPDQPGVALVLDAESGEATLYGDDVTVEDVVWTGPVPSMQALAHAAGIEHTAPFERLAADLTAAQAAGRPLHTLPPYRPAHTAVLGQIGVDDGKAGASEALIRALVALRERKSAEEVAEIEDALGVTKAAFEAAMRATRPGRFEHHVGGAAEGVVLAAGRRLAYGLIASVRGETLHNVSYHRPLSDGDLFLMDLGATSPRGYASDVTRTWPVSGRFSDLQKTLYETVLRAEEGVIERIRPGVRYLDLHLWAARSMAETLKDLGWMRGNLDDAVAAGAHALFFPHGLGHQIGHDVHDMEGLGEAYVGYDASVQRSEQFGTAYLRMAKALVPGHVVTVEPGLYVIPTLVEQWAAEKRHAEFVNYDALPAHFGFGGIRIEDNVLVTDDGHRVLGPRIPKTVAEVEALVGQDGA